MIDDNDNENGTGEKRKPVILCVDDEQFVLNALNSQLQKRFGDLYELEFAQTAKEALEIIDELAEKHYQFVMIISDQIMPGMTGDQFLSYIHKKHPYPIKILLTGQSSLESAVNAINNADLYRYLTKPWQEEDFLLTVEKGLQQYKLLEETIKKSKMFSRFVPHQFLECLSRSILDIRLGDHIQKEMSILFSDIRNFTQISESMSPEEAYNFINTYFEYLEPAIQKNNGFVDKYIGDAIMALFEKPEDALQAAIDMQNSVIRLNKDKQGEKYFPIESGIGLHVGTLMLGIVGVKDCMQSTVISHDVNIASRLERLTAIYNGRIIISEDLLKKLDTNFLNKLDIRFLGKVKIKGKETEISIFEVLNSDESDSVSKVKILTKGEFEAGLQLFLNKKFSEACVKFNAVLEENPTDKAASIYLERSAKYIVTNTPDDWDVIERVAE